MKVSRRKGGHVGRIWNSLSLSLLCFCFTYFIYFLLSFSRRTRSSRSSQHSSVNGNITKPHVRVNFRSPLTFKQRSLLIFKAAVPTSLVTPILALASRPLPAQGLALPRSLPRRALVPRPLPVCVLVLHKVLRAQGLQRSPLHLLGVPLLFSNRRRCLRHRRQSLQSRQPPPRRWLAMIW